VDFTGNPGTPNGISVRGDASTPERVVWLFDGIQDIVIGQTGETWPRCPSHGTHPLEPAADGWRCPDLEVTTPFPYGSLSDIVPPPEPKLENGHIRWFSRGRGLIARHEGDLIFHGNHVRVEALWRREMAEGAGVEYSISERRHWKLREVEWASRVE
jgi:hypothetical protein